MNNLIYSLNATMPVFLVILIGYILNRLGMFSEGFIDIKQIHLQRLPARNGVCRPCKGKYHRFL